MPTPPPCGENPLMGSYLVVKNAVLRAGVATDSEQVGQLQAGERVEVIETQLVRSACRSILVSRLLCSIFQCRCSARSVRRAYRVVRGLQMQGGQMRLCCAKGWMSLASKTSGEPLLMKCSEGGGLSTKGVVVVGEAPAAAEEHVAKFKGRHLNFLRNLANSRRKAEQVLQEKIDKREASKKKLQKKVSSICKDVLAQAFTGNLPPHAQLHHSDESRGGFRR
jgi:hypothetical protein